MRHHEEHPTLRETRNLEARFLKATTTSNLKEVSHCLKAGVDVNAFIRGSSNALHIAAERGDISLAIQLANRPDLDYNLQTEGGYTPLILAITIRKRTFVQFLLRNGANPKLEDFFGVSPLQHVCRLDDMELASDLLEYGVDVNVEDIFGTTPLITSLLLVNSLSMSKLLVKHGADIDPPTTKRSLPLFLDCILSCKSFKQVECIEFLVHSGVNVNMRERLTGRTALHFVGLTGYVPLAERLLIWGVDTEAKDVLGKTAADIAYTHSNDEVCELLIYGSEFSGSGTVATTSGRAEGTAKSSND